MSQHPDHPHMSETRYDFATPALVTIATESAGQVVLVGQGGRDAPGEPVPMRIQALKGSLLELAGPHFFPKNCGLVIRLPEHAATPGQKSADIDVQGLVRRVQMVTAAPSYTHWVRLEGCSPELLNAIRAACESSSAPLAANAVTEHPVSAGQTPDWALLLVGDGSISSAQLDEISTRAVAEGSGLAEALVKAGLVLEEKVASCVAMDRRVPFVDAAAYEIQQSNRDLVPEELARRHRLFPLFVVDGVITLGMADPTDLAVIDQVRMRANCQVDQCLATATALDSLIDQAYRAGTTEPAFAASIPTKEEANDDSASSSYATVRLVQNLVEESAKDGASDVHIEPERDKLRVRIRVDGVLHEKSVHPLAQHAPIVSRIKVLSKLDIAETRRPQDGQFNLKSAAGEVDVRVSTIPTVCGENVVLRLSLSDGKTIGLEELGLSPTTLSTIEEFLEHPNGIILVTGPTGSGKTTTLYAALTRLSTIERNVVTVEDPVERRMPLVRQTEVNPKAGLTFASGLRSILRQDPDVIMVGEIRDQETAEISVQAALTGHLVLSTLHTNTAAGAIVRLSEIGIPPYLVTSSLRAVVSQRLARKICEHCTESVDPNPRLISGLRVEDADSIEFRAGKGCRRCLNTGYRGRVGLYELLHLTPGLNAALLANASRDAIEAEAKDALVCNMREDGVRRVREGATTLDEVARIVGLERAAATSEGDS